MSKGRRVAEGVECPYCRGIYATRTNLGQHMRRVHDESLPFPCPYCPRRFHTERSAQTHQGWHHPEYRNGRNDPVRQREWNLRKNYGIGHAEYEAMLASQHFGCAGCGAPETTERTGRLHVDHDHLTGRVRGLLCSSCNHAIGKAKDNPARLRRLADYLEGR